MRFEAEGIEAAIEMAKGQVSRMRDLTPMFKQYGRWIERKVDDCFDQSKDWDGKAFPPLADSTIAYRISNLKAANKRTRTGKLTKGSTKVREKMLAPGGIKPLVDTARARNSQHFEPARDHGIWSSVGYLGYHFAGNENLPARNVSPFVLGGGNGDDWSLHRLAAEQLENLLAKHVLRPIGAGDVEAAE